MRDPVPLTLERIAELDAFEDEMPGKHDHWHLAVTVWRSARAGPVERRPRILVEPAVVEALDDREHGTRERAPRLLLGREGHAQRRGQLLQHRVLVDARE